jgi:hypothetical protein
MRRWTVSGHAVQIYDEPDELTESVSTYLAAGFEQGEPALVIATPGHRSQFGEALAGAGWDAERLEAARLLVVADVDELLGSIMAGENPAAEAFNVLVGGLLDELAERRPGQPIRVFGELVDSLCERGQPSAAAELEELWNELAQRRPFSLLCGYHLDVFDRDAQVEILPGVCRSHSHVQPGRDPARLARAVDLALHEILGAAQASKVQRTIERRISAQVPTGQLALMWVSANLPVVADRVLASARTHYREELVLGASA